MNEPVPEKSKIIIDEDWKSQVQREKDQADDPAAAESGPPGDETLPAASLTTLVMTLATQAMAALGQLQDPSQEEIPVQLPVAKHLIDTLSVLEEKTEGNLTSEEAAMMENVLHQIRMLYVGVQQAVEQQGGTLKD